MSQSKQQSQELKAAATAGKKVSMEDFIELLNSPKRLGWLNLYAGMVRGAGIVIGGALVIVLIGVAVTYLGGIPVIGEFINKVAAAAGQVSN